MLGALNARSHDLPRATTDGTVTRDTAVALLEALQAQHPAGRLTVVLDNARYVRNAAAFRAARRLRIHLLFLPPDSPNSNLIERVWKFVKKEALQGRYQEDYADFKAAIDDILDGLPNRYAGQMATLLT